MTGALTGVDAKRTFFAVLARTRGSPGRGEGRVHGRTNAARREEAGERNTIAKTPVDGTKDKTREVWEGRREETKRRKKCCGVFMGEGKQPQQPKSAVTGPGSYGPGKTTTPPSQLGQAAPPPACHHTNSQLQGSRPYTSCILRSISTEDCWMQHAHFPLTKPSHLLY